MLIFMLLTTTIGLWSNFQSGIRRETETILYDIVACFKVFVVYIGGTIYFMKYTDRQKWIILRRMIKLCFLMLVIMLPFCIANLFVDMGMRHDIRLGIPSFCFIFKGGGILAMLFYFIVPVLTCGLLTEKYNKHSKVLKWMLFISLFIWCSTMRARAFFFVLMYCLLYYYVIWKRKVPRLSMKNILVMAFLCYFIVADQAETYFDFSNDQMARANLLFYGIKTMTDYFPLGSGFATYGSDMAAKYYSPLYDKYGFEYIFGLTSDNPSLASDSYWPAVVGQFGVFGTLCMALLIFFMMKDIYQKSKSSQVMRVVGLFVIITQIVASGATATFFHFMTTSLMFFVAFLLSLNQQRALMTKQ